MADQLQVFVATPTTSQMCDLITELEPRIELVVDQELIPAKRFPGDHDGDPDFERTPAQQERFEQLCADAEVLFGIPDSDSELLAKTVRSSERLRWVQAMIAGAGAQVRRANLTTEQLRRVQFTTTAGVHADALAEFAVLGVLAGIKDLPKLQRDQREHLWAGRTPTRQLFEMTVLVIGMGNIGRVTAKYFSALGARVIGANRTVREEAGVEQVYPVDRLHQIVGEADAIVATLPTTEATKGMLDADFWSRVKPGAIFVNVGRGSTVDEPALISALQDGRVGYAALDVFAKEPLPDNSPLWDLDNVLISAHSAALSRQEDERIARLFAENARRYLDGEQLINVVNTELFY